MAAACRVIAAQGLAAPTAAIAKEAGVSNGSLFLYFETKTVLLNALYVELKTEMGAVAVAGLPLEAEPREQLRHLWTRWLQWATTAPQKRRTLAQLEVAEDITEESHQSVRQTQRGMVDLLTRCLAGGPMEQVSLGFALTLASALADATMDAMIREPGQAQAHSKVAFEAVWRLLAGGL